MSRSSALDLDRHSSLERSRRSTTLRSGSKTQATQPNTGSGEVLCDFCSSTRKQRAVNSCLSCLASYCETHLQSHYEYPALMKHKLVKSTGQMREKICAQHDKLLEVFCRTDQTSVCVLCMMDEHKHHDTVAAGTERTEKQKQLAPTLLKSQKRIDEKVKKQQELRHAIESVKHSAQSVLQENERIFMELLRSIERRYNEVKEMVGSHEKTIVNRASLLQDRLEEEITLLKKKHTDLEKLSHTDDHIHFLQSWQSLSGPSGYEDLNEISVAPNYAFDSTKKAIAALKLHVEETSKLEVSNISAAVKDVFILQPLDPKTREDFMKYSCNLTMDGNSAHPNLQLSEGNTLVKMVNEPITYPDNPGRFNHWQQVLCKEGLSGARFYWEVTWKGTEIDVAVAYKDMNRKGKSNDCSLGWNNKSWSLYCSESKYSFVHDNKSIDLVKPKSSLIGVYLDYKAGTLDFYSVSDSNMTLLHRAQSSFKEPLYPAFSVWGFGSSIQL